MGTRGHTLDPVVLITISNRDVALLRCFSQNDVRVDQEERKDSAACIANMPGSW